MPIVIAKVAAAAAVTVAVAYVGATAWWVHEFDKAMQDG